MEAVVGKEADKVKETILGSKELGQIDDFKRTHCFSRKSNWKE